jgi:hypothetical protein
LSIARACYFINIFNIYADVLFFGSKLKAKKSKPQFKSKSWNSFEFYPVVPGFDFGTLNKRLKSLPNPEGYYREDDEDNHQGDGKLKERFFHAALGAVDRIGLAEDATQAAAPHLEQGHQRQCHGDDYLGNI